MTLRGAYAGVLVGGITVLIWRQFQWLGLYELIPGFLLSALSIIVVSLLDKAPDMDIQNKFDEMVSRL